MSPNEMFLHTIRFVNNLSPDFAGFCDLMKTEHRTLQQSFTRLCLAWLKTLHKSSIEDFDLRNIASKELADAIFTQVEKNKLFLPFI